ncbi:MAG: D-tyrosyl-tRNA(Tyr) deacylase [Bernardetiaceae bacterium]|nr:D-tyrosyl-tRNA(Tyr) deacylase [Bernardetiaceae bacterium]
MIALIQKVSRAKVSIEATPPIQSEIADGLLVLLGITHTDTQKDIDWLAPKIVNLRIFEDEQNKMNRSLKDINGEIMLVSQFTLHANTKKGNRPSFMQAAKPQYAQKLYENMKIALNKIIEKPIQTGEFGAMMQVSLQNEGPVTIIIDTEKYLR